LYVFNIFAGVENSIALYLFQNKKCPLPGVGCLELLYGSAYISASEKIAAYSIKILQTKRVFAPLTFPKLLPRILKPKK